MAAGGASASGDGGSALGVAGPVTNVDLIAGRNPRGIPEMLFIDNITTFVAERGIGAADVITALNTMRQKYRTMESINIQRRERLREQNADFERTLAALTALKAKAAAGETLVTHMDYADNVFVKASVEPRDVVYIWLGAHVMLEFSYDEAETFIREQLDGAKATIAALDEDLHYLRKQATVTDVNTTRTINYEIARTRGASAEGASPA